MTKINGNNLKQRRCGEIEIWKSTGSKQLLNIDIWKVIVWFPWPNTEWVYDHLNRYRSPTPRSPGAAKDAKAKTTAIGARVFCFEPPVMFEKLFMATRQSTKFILVVWGHHFLPDNRDSISIDIAAPHPEVLAPKGTNKKEGCRH